MSRRLLTVAFVAAVGAAVLTACSASLNGSPIEPGSINTPEQPTLTVTADPPGQPTVTVTEAPPPPVTKTETVEPTYETPTHGPPPTYSAPAPSSDTELRQTTADAFTAVNAYWSDVFTGWEVTWHPPRLYGGDGFYDSDAGGGYDVCGELAAMNAGYCPASRTVSWDLQYLRLEGSLGDGPIYATVAHEVGHAAQDRFRDDGEGLATPPAWDDVRNELQADCLGATALAQTVRDGYLSISDNDLDDMAIVTEAFSSAGGGDHGTADQRIAAFNLGYHGDVESCLYNQGVSPAPDVV